MELPVLNAPESAPSIDKVRFRAQQIQGKIRRFIRSNVYTRDNDQLLAKRRGECTRCGACCKILLKCPFLQESDGQFSCEIYGEHFAQCRVFPLVPQDLREIDEDCGYYFEAE